MDKNIFSLEGIPGCDIEVAKKMVLEFGFAVVGEFSEAYEMVLYAMEDDKRQPESKIHDVNNIVRPTAATFIEQKDLGKRILIVDEGSLYECDDLERITEALEKYGIAVVSNIKQAEVLFERIKMFANPEWQQHNISIRISIIHLWMRVNAGNLMM